MLAMTLLLEIGKVQRCNRVQAFSLETCVKPSRGCASRAGHDIERDAPTMRARREARATLPAGVHLHSEAAH